MKKFNLLIIDDEEHIVSSYKRLFGREDYHISSAPNGNAGLKLVEKGCDLLLLDLRMPGKSGMEVLREALAIQPNLKVIIQTAHGSVSKAVDALKIGAVDFIEKNCDPAILYNRVKLIYDDWNLILQDDAPSSQTGTQFNYPDLIGRSHAMLQLKEMITKVAPGDVSVLIQGESGTGKELVARAIHHHSGRADREMVVVDCTTVTENMFESELFGHQKGAFTGANQATLGLIRTAEKSTLFLDEIGEIPLPVQAKLLRVIQEKTVRPVGGTVSYEVDFKLVAATNRNLFDEVANGRFRQDLFYRLNPVSLFVPPLRERKDDIDRICDKLLKSMRTPDGQELFINRAARDRLLSHSWPGNVRELVNTLIGSKIFAQDGVITADALPQTFGDAHGARTKLPDDYYRLTRWEAEAIQKALVHTDYNRKKASKLLGISEATLYRKLKEYQL
jgi:DNA-binding NtrC family response regulator